VSLRDDAACRGVDAMTDATDGAKLGEAVSWCAVCPVVDACLDFHARQKGEPRHVDLYGIVAGGLYGHRLVAELKRRRTGLGVSRDVRRTA
jgi:hypothetical protein